MVEEDIKDGCDEFLWSAQIENEDETKGLSEMTYRKPKSRYVAELLNKVNSSYKNGIPSGT